MKKLFTVLLGLLLIAGLASCSAETEKASIPVSSQPVNNIAAPDTDLLQPQAQPAEPVPAGDRQIITVSELVENSAGLMGKEVIVEGKIIQACNTGCWVDLQDPTGIIYVDLVSNNIAIAPKIGASMKVYGKVSKRSGIIYIIGSKVEFQTNG